MRIIFAGTPEFAAQTLSALLSTDHTICAVYTQPDRPAGRGKKLTASPVKQLAQEHNIPVEQPLNFKQDGAIETLQQYQADLMIVVAYGLLLPQVVLDTPKLGCINIHASLLPRWRGAAPIQRAIYAGDTETGVCIMQMEAGLDTGPVIARATCPITDTDTAQQLHDRLAQLGADTLLTTLPQLATLQQHATPQQHENSTYAKKLLKSEADIDWQQPAEQIIRQVHAFNPWPVAQTHWQDTTLRLWQAELLTTQHTTQAGDIIQIGKSGIDIACGHNAIRVTQIQAPGKRAMSSQDFLNATSLAVGDHLG